MSLVAIVARDLLVSTRIAEAARAAGWEVTRVDGPPDLPPPAAVTVAFVDWSERQPDWADDLVRWRDGVPASERPRIVLFGPHTDLEAHADARAAGLGPMLARSALFATVRRLVEDALGPPATSPEP